MIIPFPAPATPSIHPPTSAGRSTVTQVTIWGKPDAFMATYYGNIIYKHYLQLEIDRWKDKDMRNGWIEVNAKGDVAMFTDDPAMVQLDEPDETLT